MKALLALAALALGSAAIAEVPAAWRPVDVSTGQVADIDRLEALVRDFPDSGSVRLRLLQPYLEAGETGKLLDTLRWLKERGYVFGEVSREQIPKLIGEAYTDEARSLLITNVDVISASELIATAPAEAGLTETVLRDPVDDRLILTSVSERGLLGKRSYGDWDGWKPDGGGNLSGLALAPGSRVVWIASGHIDGSDSSDGFRGLIGLDHASNEEIRVPAPDGVSISDITAVEGEIVYASDPAGGGIYRAAPGDETLEVLVPPGTFRSPQGLAVSADGARLYVSDYRYGIAIIDLETRDVSRLATDLPVILDGIDGLLRYGGELVAVQNGTSPMRISAFMLSDDGTQIIEQRILEQANPAWTEPLGGSIDGDALIYVGNGQWDRFVKGEPVPGKPVLPTEIRRLPLKP